MKTSKHNNENYRIILHFWANVHLYVSTYHAYPLGLGYLTQVNIYVDRSTCELTENAEVCTW